MHFTEENYLMLKNDEKARCRALHAFLGLLFGYMQGFIWEMKDRCSLKVIYVLNFILYHIFGHKMIIHMYVKWFDSQLHTLDKKSDTLACTSPPNKDQIWPLGNLIGWLFSNCPLQPPMDFREIRQELRILWFQLTNRSQANPSTSMTF